MQVLNGERQRAKKTVTGLYNEEICTLSGRESAGGKGSEGRAKTLGTPLEKYPVWAGG